MSRELCCPRCGKKAEAGDVYCVHCGSKITAATGQNLSATKASGTAVSGNTVSSKNTRIALAVIAVLVIGFFVMRGNRIQGSWSCSQDGATVTVTFEDGGYGNIYATDGIFDVNYGFTYETQGDILTVWSSGYPGGNQVEYKIRGGSMEWYIDGETLAFQKIS